MKEKERVRMIFYLSLSAPRSAFRACVKWPFIKVKVRSGVVLSVKTGCSEVNDDTSWPQDRKVIGSSHGIVCIIGLCAGICRGDGLE